MQYSKERIVKALLLAPLPLLIFSAVLFVIMNSEYSLYSIFVISAGHALVYLAYCVLTVPFTFLISALLNRYSVLNIWTISIFSLLIATAFYLALGWSHTGEISEQWWKMYIHIPTVLMALFPGVCYWLILICLKDKSLKDEGNSENQQE